MRKVQSYIYGALIALAAVPAQAAIQFDFTPTADSILSDPTYIPSQGQLQGETSYTYTSGGANLNNSTGAQNYSFIGVSMSYAWDNRENDFVNGTTTKTNSEGFSDPDFSALYRVLDQTQYPVSFDVIASYAPDLITSEGATVANSGSVARGGQSAGVGLAVGRETRSFTVQGVTGATWYGKSTTQNATTGLDAETASYWAPYIGVNTQTRLDDRFSVNASLRNTFGADTTGATGVGTPYTTSTANDLDLGLGLNYQVIPNRLVGTISYAHEFYSDISTSYYGHPTSDSSRTDFGADLFGVHLQYVFF
jgi:hypothetical protein